MLHWLAVATLLFYGASSFGFLWCVFGRIATAKPISRILLLLGFILHSALIYPYLQSESGIVLESRGEYFFWIAWILPLLYFVARPKLDYPVVGAFISPISALFLSASSYLIHLSGGLVSETSVIATGASKTLLLIHIIPAFFAELCLVGAFILSCVFLIVERRLKKETARSITESAPSLLQLEYLSLRVIAIGFACMTFAVVSGSIWAVSTKRSLLSTDIYQWIAVIVWILLASILHLRLNMNLSGRRFSRLTVILTGSVIICFALMMLFLGNTIHSSHGV